MRIRSKLDQQRDENQKDREHQGHRQLSKARLLFLIKPTIFNSHSRRQLHVFHQLRLDLSNSRPEITSFKSTSHRDHLTQVLTLDLGLPLVNLNTSNLIQAE